MVPSLANAPTAGCPIPMIQPIPWHLAFNATGRMPRNPMAPALAAGLRLSKATRSVYVQTRWLLQLMEQAASPAVMRETVFLKTDSAFATQARTWSGTKITRDVAVMLDTR